MSGCRDGFESPAVTCHNVAVSERSVGAELPVTAGIKARGLVEMELSRGAMGTFPEGQRPRRGLDTRRRRRMIAMSMGDEDVGYGLALNGVEKRFDVRLVERAGIDHSDTIPADNVADRALEGERPWIVTEQSAHARIDLLDLAGRKIEASVERDVVTHQAAERPANTAASRVTWPSLRLRARELDHLGPLLRF